MADDAGVRILIIEDEPEKLREVVRTVEAAAGKSLHLDVAGDTQAARAFLAANVVDLAIVDLTLPRSSKEPPWPSAGLDLLEDIIERDDVYKLPAHIIGLTAYEESFWAAKYSFDLESWSLIQYDAATSEWRDRIARKIKQIRLAKSASEHAALDYRSYACILTALESPELDAVLALPWPWEAHEPADDVSVYHHARIDTPTGPRAIVAASAIRMGMAATAALATKMIHRFRPRYIIMLGITAGLKGQCNLGDVVVADPSWHWESGKHSVEGERQRFAPHPHQIFIQRKLRNRIDDLRRSPEVFASLHMEYAGDKPEVPPVMRVGPMASGSAVLSDESFLRLIKDQNRKVLAVEMEAYGLYTAAQESDFPEAHAVCLKGVSDFADGSKSDLYQPYAAYVSARAARALLESFL